MHKIVLNVFVNSASDDLLIFFTQFIQAFVRNCQFIPFVSIHCFLEVIIDLIIVIYQSIIPFLKIAQYLLLMGHRPFPFVPCVDPPPPFRDQKTTEKKSVNKKCFFQTSVSPGPPKCLRKRPQKRSAAALFSDFPFSAEL